MSDTTVYGALIRDKDFENLQKKISSDGGTIHFHKAKEFEVVYDLLKKLDIFNSEIRRKLLSISVDKDHGVTEFDESVIREVANYLDCCNEILEIYGFNLSDVLRDRLELNMVSGGFKDRIWVEYIDG